MSNVIEFSIKALDNFSANMNKLDRQLGSLGTAFQAFSGAVGVYALISFSEEIISAADEAEISTIKLNKILENTGYAAGTTAKEVEKYVQALAGTTRFSDEGIRNASTALLKFGYMAHDTFENALSAAADFAAFSGGNIEEAAANIGRAMANPEQASRLLLRAGVDLTAAQKQQIKTFEELGDKAGAQNLILNELRRVYGGLAAEMNGSMGGALARMKNMLDELFEELGSNPVISGAIKSSLENVTAAIMFLRENMEGIIEAFKILAVMAGAFLALKLATAIYAAAVAFDFAALSIARATIALRAFMAGNPIGWIAIAVGLGVAAWDKWGASADKAAAGATKAVDDVTESLERWRGVIGENEAKQKIIDDANAERRKKAKQEIDAAAKAELDAQKEILAGLQKTADTYGMTGEQIKIYDLAMRGANESIIEAAISLEGQISAQQALSDQQKVDADTFKEQQEKAKQIIESLQAPLEAHNAALQNIIASKALLSDGQFNAALEAENERWTQARAAVEWYGISVKSVSDAIGHSMAQAIVDGTSLAKGLEQVAKNVAKTIIATLIQIGVQRMILGALDKGVTASVTSQKMAAGLGEVFVNSFASAAAIPIVGWAMAPGVATANTALASAGIAASMAAGAGLGAVGGAAHGGLDYVPSESTFLLDKGERVLSPRQNTDLTSFLDNQSGGQNVTIQNLTVHVLENATNVDAFTRMDKIQLRNTLGQPVIDALNEMFSIGQRPNFAMQNI